MIIEADTRSLLPLTLLTWCEEREGTNVSQFVPAPKRESETEDHIEVHSPQ